MAVKAEREREREREMPWQRFAGLGSGTEIAPVMYIIVHPEQK